MVHDFPEPYRKIIKYVATFIHCGNLNCCVALVNLTVELPDAVASNEHFVLHQVQSVFIKSCFRSTHRNGVQDFVVYGHRYHRSVHEQYLLVNIHLVTLKWLCSFFYLPSCTLIPHHPCSSFL